MTEPAFVLAAGLWLAPRGAGKSYGAALGRWIDGDVVIHEAIGWPKTPNWWKDREIASVTHAANIGILAAYCRANVTSVVMFNGAVPTTLVRSHPKIMPVLRGVILPSSALISRNLETHPHALHHATLKQRIDEILPNRDELRRVAEDLHLPIIQGERADALMTSA